MVSFEKEVRGNLIYSFNEIIPLSASFKNRFELVDLRLDQGHLDIWAKRRDASNLIIYMMPEFSILKYNDSRLGNRKRTKFILLKLCTLHDSDATDSKYLVRSGSFF